MCDRDENEVEKGECFNVWEEDGRLSEYACYYQEEETPPVKTDVSEPIDWEENVDSYLLGTVFVNRALVNIENERIIILKNHRKLNGKVKILAGGMVCFEPLFTGLIGEGMLTGTVFGGFYSAPPTSVILTAVRELSHECPHGVLLFVMNYVGDRLSFGMALERARQEGLNVEMVVVGDDCSGKITDKAAGRRGLAGISLAIKIAGAMAYRCRQLHEIAQVCRHFCGELATITASLTPQFDEVQFGIGLRGEPGVKTVEGTSMPATVWNMINFLLNPINYFALAMEPKVPIVVLINNIGQSAVIERLFVKQCINLCACLGVRVARVIAGSLMGSVCVKGFSISVAKLTSDEMMIFLDDRTEAPAWPRNISCSSEQPVRGVPLCVFVPPADRTNLGPRFKPEQVVGIKLCLEYATEALISCESQLNKMDCMGNCGTKMKTVSKVIQIELRDEELQIESPYALFIWLSELFGRHLSGTSGALYSVMFAAAAQGFLKNSVKTELSMENWVFALNSAVHSVNLYGHAVARDKTLIDALQPAYNAIKKVLYREDASGVELTRLAVEAAEEGARSTIDMKPRAGKSASFCERSSGKADPGAHALAIWMRAVLEALKVSIFHSGSPSQEELYFACDTNDSTNDITEIYVATQISKQFSNA